MHFPALSIVVNFLILLGMLVYFTRKPLNQMLEDKSEMWKVEVSEAEALRIKTQEMYEVCAKKMENLDSDIKHILDEAQSKGEAEMLDILKRADKKAEKIVLEAKAIAEQELQNAREKIKADMIVEAAKAAEKELKEKIKETDNDFFVRSFSQEMEMSSHG